MTVFVTFLFLAQWIFSVSATGLANENAPAPFQVNVTAGGFFDDLPRCSHTCSLAILEYIGCDPTDSACICSDSEVPYRLDTCFDMYCSLPDYYEGRYLYHVACNTEVRNQSSTLTTAAITTASIALAAVCLRLITRTSRFSVRWGSDDWVVMGIALVAAGQLALLLTMVHYGIGQDIYMLTPTTISNAAKYLYFSELTFVILTFSTKIAILCFYLRLFPTGEIRIVTYLLITVCSTAMFSIFLAHLFQCWPLSFRWRMYLGEEAMDSESRPMCRVDRQTLNFAFSIFNLVIEVFIISLPIPRLLKLQMQWWKKIEVVSIFAFGFVITIIAITRLSITLTASYSENFTYEYIPVLFWCAIEIYISIFIVCLPQVHLVGKSIVQRFFKSNSIKMDTSDDATLVPVWSKNPMFLDEKATM